MKMETRHIEKIPFGKKIENNLVKSLRMAGIKLKTGAELDHNHKVDFILKLKNKKVGIQFSLGHDDIKAKAAKFCAMDIVPHFIYLSMAMEYFDRPDKRNGKDLYLILDRIVEQYSGNKALSVNIDHHGLQVHAL